MSNSLHLIESHRPRDIVCFENGHLNGEMFLQALNGFIIILTCEGEVFFATHTIESYLGFHQSDIVHQSVYELVHSEDREELQRQLLWNTFLPPELTGIQLADALVPEKSALLDRSFTIRFRCLLDNTSGFLRLDIRGKVKVLHGQNQKLEEPPLALFAFCTPFGPPSMLEIPHKENMFKSKHKLDFSLVSMDHKGKQMLGYSDSELANMGGYDLVHFDDLAYVASAHQELLKTGASGMIAYRYQKKGVEWQWLQTSSRLVYKNSKPDFIICTHRQLMEEEGRDLLGKRTMDFKVSYLDTGLTSTYFTDADQLISTSCGSPSTSPITSQQRYNRRYKTQLRDFLSTCRTKRKHGQQSSESQTTSPTQLVDYMSDSAVAVAAAYSNLNPIYSTPSYVSSESLYMTPPAHSTNFYAVSDNIFHQYRLQSVGTYYSEYPSTPPSYITSNNFIAYDTFGVNKDERWQSNEKGIPLNNGNENYSSVKNIKQVSPTNEISTILKPSSPTTNKKQNLSGNTAMTNCVARNNTCKNQSSSKEYDEDKEEEEDIPQRQPEPRRQTVLMWGSWQKEKRSPSNKDAEKNAEFKEHL